MNIKLIALLSLIIMVLGATLVIQKDRLKKALTERDQAINYSLAKDGILEQLTTKLGQASARSEVLELSNRNLRKLQEDKDLAWIREIKAVNKRLNNVEQIMAETAYAAWNFKISLQDTLISIQPAFPADTAARTPMVARKFDNSDKWIRLKGYILPDTIVISPQMTVPLKSVVYWERGKGFLGLKIGRKKWHKETTSPNPYVRIIENKIIKVTKRKRR